MSELALSINYPFKYTLEAVNLYLPGAKAIPKLPHIITNVIIAEEEMP